MNIFDLHASVVADYRDFVRSFFTVADDRARAFVEQTLDAEARLWPDFLLQISPSYDRVTKVICVPRAARASTGRTAFLRRCLTLRATAATEPRRARDARRTYASRSRAPKTSFS